VTATGTDQYNVLVNNGADSGQVCLRATTWRSLLDSNFTIHRLMKLSTGNPARSFPYHSSHSRRLFAVLGEVYRVHTHGRKSQTGEAARQRRIRWGPQDAARQDPRLIHSAVHAMALDVTDPSESASLPHPCSLPLLSNGFSAELTTGRMKERVK
jgi:hypothetical protein